MNMENKTEMDMKKTTEVNAREVIELHHVIGGEDTHGWIHTHGMDKFNLPELEIRGVPGFLAASAARILYEVCDYLLNGGHKVEVGESMSLGEGCRFRFVRAEPIKGQENHYLEERWLLADMGCTCGQCEKTISEAGAEDGSTRPAVSRAARTARRRITLDEATSDIIDNLECLLDDDPLAVREYYREFCADCELVEGEDGEKYLEVEEG